MKKFLLLWLLPAVCCAQGARFDSNVFTAATNVPYGGQAPMFTIPYSMVTVCAYPASGSPCTNTAPIYQDQALTIQLDQPITADAYGRFGFWATPGQYAYSVVTPAGNAMGPFAFTLAGGGGGGGNINPAPQFRLFIQPNAGTQAVAGPAVAGVNAVAPMLQGQLNSDLYGGISAAFASSDCASGCTVVVPPNSTDATNPFMPPTNGQALYDWRAGRLLRMTRNPSSVVCDLASSAVQSADCLNTLLNGNIFRGYAHNTVMKAAGPGYNLGFSPNTPVQGASVSTMFEGSYEADTRGIAQLWGATENAHAIGDKAGAYFYLNTDGGQTDGSGEGGVGLAAVVTETSSYIHATILSGGTTGSALLTTHLTTGQNVFTDGGYLLDITKGGTVTGTIASTATTMGWGVWNLTGASMPVSTAWGTFASDTNASANGQYQIAVPQTLNVTLGTSPASPGDFAVGNNVCLVNGFIEQVPITAVSPSSGGVQGITFSTRYAWKAGTLIMQGGMCGQYFTNTANPSWRTAIAAIGSFSSSQVVPAACNHGTCQLSGGGTAVVGGVGDSITQFPGAEIIGTGGGLLNTVQLGLNTAPWANGDTIEGPHPPTISLVGMKNFVTQRTKGNTAGSSLYEEGWTGVNPTGSLGLHNTNINLTDGSTINFFWRIVSGTSLGPISSLFTVDVPTTIALDFSGITAAKAQNMTVFRARQPNNLFSQINYTASDGSYSFLKDTSSLAIINAANVPALGTIGQFPIVTNSGGNTTYVPRTLSGDATLSDLGVMTLNTVNTVPGTCGDATHVCQINADAKGRITSQTAVPITTTTTGFSGTKTGAACVFTIANGLITNVTGC